MRLIDADALFHKFDTQPWYDNADRDEIALPEIDKAPTIDAVLVVRCRDCKHLYGTLCTVCGLLPRKPDDFCSYGEYQTNGGADHENQRN